MKAILQKYRAAAAVSLVLLVVLLLAGGLFFTQGMIEARESELAARQIQIEALKRRAAQPASAQRGQARTVDPLFGDNFALAANEMQKRVVGLIESAGGTLVSIGVDPPVNADDDSGRRVVVQAVAEMSNDALQEVLYRLEADAPFVFVDNLAVSRANTRGSGNAPAGDVSPPLSVDLRAAGYFRRAAP